MSLRANVATLSHLARTLYRSSNARFHPLEVPPDSSSHPEKNFYYSTPAKFHCSVAPCRLVTDKLSTDGSAQAVASRSHSSHCRPRSLQYSKLNQGHLVHGLSCTLCFFTSFAYRGWLQMYIFNSFHLQSLGWTHHFLFFSRLLNVNLHPTQALSFHFCVLLQQFETVHPQFLAFLSTIWSRPVWEPVLPIMPMTSSQCDRAATLQVGRR